MATFTSRLLLALLALWLAWIPAGHMAGPPRTGPRPFPDTTNGIYVFDDQLDPSMSEAQYQFSATHYVGTQKMLRRDADHLRRYNPNFLIMHYRLPIGESDATVRIIDGNNWVTDYYTVTKHEKWFYHIKGSREFLTQWHWYLMNPASAGWRTYWVAQVNKALVDNADDAVFADSLSVPNYFGGSAWKPPLPDYDPAFEAWWSKQITAFLVNVRPRLNGKLIPNAGNWVTTRDTTDYSPVDGVMIEGFAEWGAHNPYALADWQIQMDRILSLELKNKIIIAQNYVTDPTDLAVRRFYLGNYLLIKGSQTYVNMELSLMPEWFPEYGTALGAPTQALTGDITSFHDAASGLYKRTYGNGLVLVNPDTSSHTISLGGIYYLVTPVGGGLVPSNGDISGWKLTYTPVTSVTVAANDAAVLVVAPGT